MLIHLHIDNVAIASHLDIEFHRGMTVITGETGAGKSIMLDALGLALGDRGDAGVVRAGAERSDIIATFDISNIKEAQAWLKERDLYTGDECLLRRVITQEGRSRAYINTRPATLGDLKQLGNLLIDIHSQHAHQSLLKKEQQQRLLDEYAELLPLKKQLRETVDCYTKTKQTLKILEEQRNEQDGRIQLLGYQVEELDQLNLEESELESLENEQKQLANAELIQQASQHALALCKEGEINVINILNQALRSLEEIPAKSHSLSEATQLLSTALIHTEEASHEIETHVEGFDIDPERLLFIDQRLNQIYDIARKHKISATEIPALHQQLKTELDSINGSHIVIDELQNTLAIQLDSYQKHAEKLSKKRRIAAKKLQKQVEEQLQSLAMNNCRFQVDLSDRKLEGPHPQGNEDVQFLISTNPGQAPQALNRIASGGELSRISLAIQVITAQTSAIPTLVFDEVDVGIGGATAEIVGKLLHELGEKGQVLCVTHQPQVAAKGHNHLLAFKSSSKKTVSTSLNRLREGEKIEEIARMLGGIDITDTSRDHAREMLAIH